MDNTSLAAGAEATFTVTNSHVSAKSVVVVNAASGQTADTSVAVVSAVAAGSFDITITNLHASTADTGAMVINFIVIEPPPRLWLRAATPRKGG
jgi:glucosamine 6-phosphate synthetase-like amidotransferase/phosphosugar isomerase protein